MHCKNTSLWMFMMVNRIWSLVSAFNPYMFEHQTMQPLVSSSLAPRALKQMRIGATYTCSSELLPCSGESVLFKVFPPSTA